MDFHSGALAPYLELINGCGAEGVARHQQHGLSCFDKLGRDLADGGGFAHAVHAHHHEHKGAVLRQSQLRRAVGGKEEGENLIAQHLLQCLRITELVALDPCLGRLQQMQGRIHAEIGSD